MPVGASADSPRSASSAAPAATLSWDCGVVTTGARSRSDSRWVTSGMPAPPPTVATADEAGHRNLVALQRFFDRVEHAGQRLLDEVLQLGAGQPDVGAEAGQFGGHHGRGLGGQPFLGLPALVAQPGQRPDRRGAGGVGVVGFGDAGDDVVEQRLVDLVAGEVGIADASRRWWRSSSAASASVMLVPLPPKSHSATTPPAGSPGAVCSAVSAATESGISVGGHAVGREAGLGPQRAPQRSDGCGTPVRGDGDRDGRAAADRAGHRVEGFDEDLFAAVRGAVGRDERHRIADPVDEAAQHQARLVEVGVLATGRRPRAHDRCNSVRTERRMTGGRPTRAATRLVIPIDNPSESVMSCSPSADPTIAAWAQGSPHFP